MHRDSEPFDSDLIPRWCGAILLCLCAALPGRAWGQQPPHHTPEGFRNNYAHPPKESFWAWKWEQLRRGVPAAPPGGWRIPVVAPDAAAPGIGVAGPAFTWIGHATILLKLAGRNVLFDPIFSDRASPVPFLGPRRVVPLTIDVPDLPRIDVVVISHNHYDHLDEASVKRLAAMPAGSPLFLVPLGLKAWFAAKGIERVEELDWWQARDDGPLRLTLVPVQHWSKRTLFDTNETLWGGWVVEGGGQKVVHTGDLGYSRDVKDIGERLGPFDLAFIPIGGYAPRWFMKLHHVDVPEALQVRADLRARLAIGIHWGTFEGLTDEPLDEPSVELARHRAAAGLSPAQFDVMRIGETRRLD